MSSEAHTRTELLLGKAAVERLAGARVAVCGLGAVGGFALEALARAGVGQLVLADFDCVHASNINRQLLALHSTVGESKCDLAQRRVLDIQPECRVTVCEAFLDDATLPAVFEPAPDVVIDAIDSLSSKVRLLAEASRRGLAVVASMGAATRLDPEAVRVGPLMNTHGCPLARLVRKRLRRLGVDGGSIQAVYSVEPSVRGYALGEELPPERDAPGRGRRPLGSCSTITALFGLRAAHEVLRLLLGVERWEDYPPR